MMFLESYEIIKYVSESPFLARLARAVVVLCKRFQLKVSGKH